MSSLLFRFHDLIGGVHVPIDDGIDKLNRKYTLLIFLFLALPIFTKQYMGEPIECFTPTYFTEAQSRYMNSHCWTSSTYYIVADESGDAAGEVLSKPQQPVMMEEFYYEGLDAASLGPDRLRRVRVGYYQWTALFLLVQGFCFHLPFIIWGSFANNAGVKLRRLLKRASDIAALPPGCQQREALLVEFVDQFSVLVTGKDTGGCCEDPTCRFPLLCRWANGPSRYLCVLYLVVKALYVVNVGLQFLLLTMFMGKGFLRHGFEVLHRLATDGEWWNSPRFPLQTLCRVRVEDELTLRTFIFRCVLPINVFNEKIYSTVWFYLAFLLPLNAFSLAIWIWRCFPWNRLAFVKLILWRTKMFGMSELSRVARKISFSHLGWDGVFILRMIEHNHGSSMTTLILGKIWEFYVAEMKAQEDATSGGANELVEPVAGTSVAGPSTSWHSTCACHVPHFGTPHHHSHHSLPHTKRRSHPGVWENCL